MKIANFYKNAIQRKTFFKLLRLSYKKKQQVDAEKYCKNLQAAQFEFFNFQTSYGPIFFQIFSKKKSIKTQTF